MPPPNRKPLDPNSPAGIAATEALLDMLAAMEIAVEERRRAANTATPVAATADSEAA